VATKLLGKQKARWRRAGFFFRAIWLLQPLGRDNLVEIKIGNTHIHGLADPKLELKISEEVKLKLNTDKVQFFDAKTEQSMLWT